MAGETVSPMANKIDQIIREFGQDVSFSAEAMKQFLGLKAACDEYEAQNKELRRDLEKDKDMIGDLNSHIRSMEGHIEALETEKASFRGRESELIDREMQCTANEVRMECANARVEDHQSMVGLIFRNTELRKRSFGEEQKYQPGCVEIKDEYGNIKQYAEQAGHVPVPVKKEELSSEE